MSKGNSNGRGVTPPQGKGRGGADAHIHADRRLILPYFQAEFSFGRQALSCGSWPKSPKSSGALAVLVAKDGAVMPAPSPPGIWKVLLLDQFGQNGGVDRCNFASGVKPLLGARHVTGPG